MLRTRFGLALAVVLLLATFFRLVLPPMVVADASMESICTAGGKSVSQNIDPQSSGGMHSHSSSCDYCLLDFDDLVALLHTGLAFAFSQAVSIKVQPIALPIALRLSWATPHSRAPPSITV
jgi:hypothetical protein